MLIIFYLIISASAHAAGGIALGATRIIYPADAKQTAVWIRNGHTNERFLVNSLKTAAVYKKSHASLHRHCLLVNPKAKILCVLFTPVHRWRQIVSLCSG